MFKIWTYLLIFVANSLQSYEVNNATYFGWILNNVATYSAVIVHSHRISRGDCTRVDDIETTTLVPHYTRASTLNTPVLINSFRFILKRAILTASKYWITFKRIPQQISAKSTGHSKCTFTVNHDERRWNLL